MSIEDLWLESPEVQDTRYMNAHLCQQRITLDSYVVGGSLWPVLYEFSFSSHITVHPGCPDNKHY
jgi:hypothetical protein